jgi:hypothetical protein
MISISGFFLHRFTASNPFLAISIIPNIFKILDINFNEILSSATSILIFVVQNSSLAVVGFFFSFIGLIRGILKQNTAPLSGLFFCPYFTT